MSFPSWLQNLRSALSGQRHHRRQGSLRAATHRPNLEVLEDRLTLSLNGAGSYPVGPYVAGVRAGDFDNDGHIDLATGSSVLLGNGDGTFQDAVPSDIVDDEPRISISDVTKSEGKKGGTTLFTFTVTLSAAYDQAVTLLYRTVNGTATTSDKDYVAQSGTLNFALGETTKTITIIVNGDGKREADEYFYLDLFGNSSNWLFTKSRGTGTILNDD